MSRTSNISRSDLLLKGRCSAPNAPVSGSKPGMHMAHTMLYRLGAGSPQGLAAPIVADADGLCAAQAIAGAANASINGALASGGVATLDCARGLVVLSSNAGDTTQTVTITGRDILGRAVVETIALNGTTPVNGKKAFGYVSQVAVSAAMTGNLTVGTTNIFGLPVRCRVGDVLIAKVDGAVPEAGTFVAGDTTSPPTATTGDPLGTFLSGTAPNGTRVFTYLLNVEDSTESAYGSQFSG